VLREEILKKQKEKEALDAEKARLEAQIQETNKQAQSLQGTVNALDATGKKLQNDLKVTENRIGGTELSIQKITIELGTKERQIEQNKEAIGETIKTLYQNSETSLIESLMKYKNISELWDSLEAIRRFQTVVKNRTNELADLRVELEGKKNEDEQAKKSLLGFKSQLASQKEIVEENKQAKAILLTETKNQEAEYKKQLADNLERGRQFQLELFKFESQLQAHIDKTKLPTQKPGVLAWPLDSVFVTQPFGKTSDSGRLYVSGTHNGVDFRASVGTPIKSVGAGVVDGIGNTDDQRGCYSYGRWILIKHSNGLSSMYAHLSGINVSRGQTVASGDIIGYSGGQPGMPGSGYSTGPHLHLGLFASEGVTVQKYTSSNFCKEVSIPMAGLNAYLDPLAYLPPVN
jgi:murein DD-endopeptidase MepM/ murein hydrolase activator NlpD